MDEIPRMSRSRHRSHSCRRSSRHSRSYSPRDSTMTTDNNNSSKTAQFIPIPVPYYHPQSATALSQGTTTQTQMTSSSNNHPRPVSYIIPQTKQQYVEDPNVKKNDFSFI